MDKPNNKGGRPRIYPSGEKRPTLGFRVRAGMYEKLKVSAEASGRSLSEEIERILNRHFEVDVIREMIREEMRRVPVMSGGE